MITINKILCPVDFFPASDTAVSYAVDLGANYSATIHLLHVITPILPNEYAIDTTHRAQTMPQFEPVVAGFRARFAGGAS